MTVVQIRCFLNEFFGMWSRTQRVLCARCFNSQRMFGLWIIVSFLLCKSISCHEIYLMQTNEGLYSITALYSAIASFRYTCLLLCSLYRFYSAHMILINMIQLCLNVFVRSLIFSSLSWCSINPISVRIYCIVKQLAVIDVNFLSLLVRLCPSGVDRLDDHWVSIIEYLSSWLFLYIWNLCNSRNGNLN